MAENTIRGFDSRKDKTAVNYRISERCGHCDSFRGGLCVNVEGSIAPDTVCDLWQLRSAPTYKDGQFYLDEYKKTGKA